MERKVTANLYYGSVPHPVSDLPECDWSQPTDALVTFWFKELGKRAGGYFSSMARDVKAMRNGDQIISIVGNGWSVYSNTEEGLAQKDPQALLALYQAAERAKYTPEQVLKLAGMES